MSEDTDALTAGLKVFSTVMTDIQASAIEIMRVHPAIGIMMFNLLSNIGYVIFAVEDDNGQYELGQWGLAAAVATRKFDSKQELMSYCFRQGAIHSAKSLDADVVKSLGQVFNLSKLVGALK